MLGADSFQLVLVGVSCQPAAIATESVELLPQPGFVMGNLGLEFLLEPGLLALEQFAVVLEQLFLEFRAAGVTFSRR